MTPDAAALIAAALAPATRRAYRAAWADFAAWCAAEGRALPADAAARRAGAPRRR
ncbi:hypothetical protein [Caenispirillum salinarum]|uniref:hypothetical protein n=1 Tax=Caenispirillum salinarum TaxID=859058 RepID=UPI00384FD98F